MADTHAGAQNGGFKRCTACTASWMSRTEFLDDPTIALAGYQAFLPAPIEGLFLFNHTVCETTLAIRAEAFADLYDGPMYQQPLYDTDVCLNYCSTVTELSPCPNECECAFVRSLLPVLEGWPKRSGA